jgi:pyrimidine deaminase RibD-like protein
MYVSETKVPISAAYSITRGSGGIRRLTHVQLVSVERKTAGSCNSGSPVLRWTVRPPPIEGRFGFGLAASAGRASDAWSVIEQGTTPCLASCVMDEREIFTFLFRLAETSRDPEGVVASCLMRDRELLASSASSDDGRQHAEYLVVQQLRDNRISVDERCVLYTTLAPCSDVSTVNDGRDCTTILLEAGVRHVVFAADDLEYSKSSQARFQAAGGTCRQINDRELVRRAVQVFNSTISRDLSRLFLPRERQLESPPDEPS